MAALHVRSGKVAAQSERCNDDAAAAIRSTRIQFDDDAPASSRGEQLAFTSAFEPPALRLRARQPVHVGGSGTGELPVASFAHAETDTTRTPRREHPTDTAPKPAPVSTPQNRRNVVPAAVSTPVNDPSPLAC